MTDEKFVHLHSHTHYSRLDGLCTPKAMAKEAKAKGFKSLAITDHGTCAGWLNFQKACRSEGIKPILGSELYMTDDMKQKDKHSRTYHLLLLAKNGEGMKNLMHLSTLAETQGKYRYPRIDFDLLAEHSEGLICTSGCPSSQISKSIIEDDGRSLDLIHKYHDVFKDDFYMEVMTHSYTHKSKAEWQRTERELAKQVVKLSRDTGIKAIATNDNHYARKLDSKYHDMLLGMQTKDNMNNPDRFTLGGSDFYIKTYEEMHKIYGKIPDLLSNTVEISEKIPDIDLLTFTPDLLPPFHVPEGYKSEEAYLKALISDGLKSKGFFDIPEYRARIKFEMETILKCGYTKYFLILWDIMNFAARQGIRTGIGRGCFTPDCLVDCILDGDNSSGDIVIQEGQKKISDIKKGDEVLSYDGKYHEVTDVLEYDIEEEIIEIELEDGRLFECTLDHEIHVLREGVLVWVKAGELTEEDDIYDIRSGH